MFNLPFASTLHHALSNHAFGRAPGLAAAPAAPLPPAPANDAQPLRAADEACDLAQRVRNVGEW